MKKQKCAFMRSDIASKFQMGLLFFIITSTHVLCASWDQKDSSFIKATVKQNFLRVVNKDNLVIRIKGELIPPETVLSEQNDRFVSAIFDNDTKQVQNALSDREWSEEELSAALLLAVTSGKKELVDLFIKRGAYVSYRALSIAYHFNYQRIALSLEHILLKSSLPSEIRQALKERFGNNALVQAISDDDRKRVQSLLRDGADVNMQVASDDPKIMLTPISLAIVTGSREMIKLLLNKGTDIKKMNLLLGDVIDLRTIDCAYELLKYSSNINVNEADSHGITPLMKAVWFDSDERSIRLIKLLLKKGADPCTRCDSSVQGMGRPGKNCGMVLYQTFAFGPNQGKSVLNWALERWHSPDIIKLLLEKGADVSYKTPLVSHLRSKSPYAYDVAKLLLEKDASVRDGNPLEVALEVFQDITGLVSDNDTYAKEYVSIVKLLVEKGADVDTQGAYGKTARDIAKELSNPEVNALLLGS